MSKEVMETVDRSAATGGPPAGAEGQADKPKVPASSSKAKRPSPSPSKHTLPAWWPKAGLLAVGGCLVVRLDPERYKEIVATEKELGIPAGQLAAGAVAAAVNVLSDEVATEAERLRPLIRSIDEEDERYANELIERKAARLERARQLLAKSAEPGYPN